MRKANDHTIICACISMYIYFYTLTLTSYLDAVEWSTPRIACSTLKDTWCTSTGR